MFQGGADQNLPVLVSRVAPNTPADLCIPRLNEGDQVLFINGRDISQHTHEQVCWICTTIIIYVSMYDSTMAQYTTMCLLQICSTYIGIPLLLDVKKRFVETQLSY